MMNNGFYHSTIMSYFDDCFQILYAVLQIEHNKNALVNILYLHFTIVCIQTVVITFFCISLRSLQNDISFVEKMAPKLSAVDYVLLVILLLASAVIGAIFGFFKSKKSSAKEFLLGTHFDMFFSHLISTNIFFYYS